MKSLIISLYSEVIHDCRLCHSVVAQEEPISYMTGRYKLQKLNNHFGRLNNDLSRRICAWSIQEALSIYIIGINI